MQNNAEVDAWFDSTSHPLAEVMQRVRDAILPADARVEESIKWKSPTFCFNGNIASMNPRAKKYVSLMLHRRADIPGDFPNLQGGGEVARYMRFDDAHAVELLLDELQAIVRAWCETKASS